MKVFRLTRSKYSDDFSGRGAAISGARWNSRGTEIIYTSESRALAMAEVAVHLSLNELPDDYLMLEITIPDSMVFAPEIDLATLPVDWKQFPPSISTQQIGDRFVEANEHCVLRVPSAIVKGDFNILINPQHADFFQIGITGTDDFPFDRRLIPH